MPRILASNWYVALSSQEILSIKKSLMFRENAPIFSAFSHNYSCDTLCKFPLCVLEAPDFSVEFSVIDRPSPRACIYSAELAIYIAPPLTGT